MGKLQRILRLLQTVAKILVAKMTMVGDCKAMRLVAETSADEERLGIAGKKKVLAPVVEDDLLLSLGKAYRRHVVDAKFCERGTRRARRRTTSAIERGSSAPSIVFMRKWR